MSTLQHIKRASQKKSEDPSTGKEFVNRFSDIETIDQRRHRVLDYLVMGWQADEIAEDLDMSLATIKTDIEEIYKIGYGARGEDIETVRDEIMRMYRFAAREGSKAFKRSQGEHEKITNESGSGANGPIDKEKIVSEELAGDPRFLSIVIDAGKEMGKLSGAQKHKEIEVQTNIQNNNTVGIMAPNRARLPQEFDRWTKKPEGEDGPTVGTEDQQVQESNGE